MTRNSIGCARIATTPMHFLVELERASGHAPASPTCKLEYNRVHGFYIEVTHGQSRQGARATTGAARP